MEENSQIHDIGSSSHVRSEVISDVGMLDLRYAKTQADLAGIRKISDVGVILISEGLEGGLSGITVEDVGGIIPIPEGGKVNILSGQTRLSGEALAAGDPDTSLIVVGRLFVTTPVLSVGFKEIRVHGQLFAGRESEVAITSKLTSLNGQNMFLPENPRFFMGESTLNQEFFELLDKPESLVVMGCLILDEDVQRDTVRAKVTEIVLMGAIKAPRHLLAVLEVLTKQKLGNIETID